MADYQERYRRLRVFLSSPGDVARERDLARRVIRDLPREPQFQGRLVLEEVSWDDPGTAVPLVAHLTPQEAINKSRPKPSECDVVLVILWGRMGTPLPQAYTRKDGSPYLSGTEWEYLDAITAAQAKGTPDVLVYRSQQEILLNPDSSDFDEAVEQMRRLRQFIASFRHPDGSLKGSYHEYPSPEEFAPVLEDHLRTLVWKRFTEAEERQTPQGQADPGTIEQMYRERLVREFKHVQLHAIVRSVTEISLSLEDLFVDLRIVSDVPEDADAFSAEERRLLLRRQSGRARDALQRSQLDALRRERWNATPRERRTIGEMLQQSASAATVVLGDPGSGKTTLLRLLALLYARGAPTVQRRFQISGSESDRIPIFAPFAALERCARTGPGLAFIDLLTQQCEQYHAIPGLARFLTDGLRQGRALVLLDGIDEVVDLHARDRFSRHVNQLIDELAGSGTRFFITSRIIGYRELRSRLAGQHTTILDFSDEDIETFVRRWSNDYERGAHIGRSEEEIQHAISDTEKALLTELRGNRGARNLAANPLMLTMLALLHRQSGSLPSLRATLYEHYFRYLIDGWVRVRSPEATMPAVDAETLSSILTPLGLWLLQSSRAGLASRGELLSKLTELLGADAATGAESLLNSMREQAGLIVERGPGVYGFLHLTFEEYFAARALAALGPDRRWSAIAPHLHDTKWREPLLLCVQLLAAQGDARAATALVQRVRELPDATEAELHRNLALALELAAENPLLDVPIYPGLTTEAIECLQATPVRDLRERLIRALAKLIVNDCIDVDECWQSLVCSGDKPLSRLAAAELSEFAYFRPLRDRLLPLVREDEPDLSRAVMERLTPFATSDADVQKRLLDMTRVQNRHLVQSAISALTPAAADVRVRDRMIDLLGDERMLVDGLAAEALASISNWDALARDCVIAFVRRGTWMHIDSVLERLGAWAGQHEDIRAVLLECVRSFTFVVYVAAGRALAPLLDRCPDLTTEMIISPGDPSFSSWRLTDAGVAALSRVVKHREDARQVVMSVIQRGRPIRPTAIEVLAPLAPQNYAVADAILACLRSDEAETRRAAIAALAGPSAHSPLIHQAIADTAGHTDPDTRKATALALHRADHTPRLIRLMRALSNDLRTPNAALGHALTLRALAALAHTNEAIETKILEWSSDREFLRVAALQALAAIDRPNDSALAAIDTILHDADPDVREAATIACIEAKSEVLRERGLKNFRAISQWTGGLADEVIDAILEAERTDKERLDCLVSLAPGSHFAQQRLRELVSANPKLIDTLVDDLELSSAPRSYHAAMALLVVSTAISGEPVERIRAAGLASWQAQDKLALNAVWWALGAIPATTSTFTDALGEQLAADAGKCAQLFACLPQAGSSEQKDNLSRLQQTTLLRASPAARAKLLGTLPSIHPFLLSGVEGSLADIVSEHADIRDAMLELLASDDRHYLRWCAAHALAPLATTDTTVRETLLRALEHDEDADVRVIAINALAEERANPEITARIEMALHDPENQVARAAAHVLTQSMTADLLDAPWVFGWLTATPYIHEKGPRVGDLYSDVEKLRRQIARGLAPFLSKSPLLVERLRILLRSPRWPERLGAATTLAFWPGSPPRDVLSEIVTTLDDWRGAESYGARLAAAEYLINLDPYSADAVELGFEALTCGCEVWEMMREARDVRRQAARLLGALEPLYFSESVYDRLRHHFESESDLEVKNDLYRVLLRLAALRDQQFHSEENPELN